MVFDELNLMMWLINGDARSLEALCLLKDKRDQDEKYKDLDFIGMLYALGIRDLEIYNLFKYACYEDIEVLRETIIFLYNGAFSLEEIHYNLYMVPCIPFIDYGCVIKTEKEIAKIKRMTKRTWVTNEEYLEVFNRFNYLRFREKFDEKMGRNAKSLKENGTGIILHLEKNN